MAFAFRPVGLTVTAAPNNTNVSSVVAPGAENVLITNAGSSVCFVRVQPEDGAVAASAVDVPVLGGVQAIIDVPPGMATPLAVSVFSAGSITVYITPGQGGI